MTRCKGRNFATPEYGLIWCQPLADPVEGLWDTLSPLIPRINFYWFLLSGGSKCTLIIYTPVASAGTCREDRTRLVTVAWPEKGEGCRHAGLNYHRDCLEQVQRPPPLQIHMPRPFGPRWKGPPPHIF